MNFFSITVLVIAAALSQQQVLAADIALAQAAVMAVFYSLSANARNLILTGEPAIVSVFLRFRLLTVLPALLLTLAIGWIASVPFFLILIFTIRKAMEWFAELTLAADETRQTAFSAQFYVVTNCVGLAGVFAMLLFLPEWFLPCLLIWALLPGIQIGLRHIALSPKDNSFFTFERLYPHIGSTTVISIATFLFRLMIVFLAGKALAGELFAGFAVGSLVTSVYIQSLGPALIAKQSRHEYRVALLMILGMLVAATSMVFMYDVISSEHTSEIFILTCGLSVLGGIVMLFAQRKRLMILNHPKRHSLWPDLASNVGMLIGVCLLYLNWGVMGLSAAFLLSGIMSLLCFNAVRWND